jgi:hypothetical protein
MYLNWEGAVGKEELRQLPGSLRVRRAHDLGWKPGLWLRSDHDSAAVKPKPESLVPTSAAVVAEFA